MTKQELLNAFCAAVDGLSTAPANTLNSTYTQEGPGLIK